MDKLKLLVWKHFKTQLHSKTATILEILSPVLPILAMILIRIALKVEAVDQPTVYPPFSPAFEIPKVVKDMANVILYAPANPLTDHIIHHLRSTNFDNRGLNYSFVGFEGEKELMSNYQERFHAKPRSISASKSSSLLAAIIFENIRSHTLPSHIKYTLKFPSRQRTAYDALKERSNLRPGWFTDYAYPIIPFRGPRSKTSPQGGFPGYFDEGFLYLQSGLDACIAQLLLNREQKKQYDAYEIKLERFPFPAYKEDNIHFILQNFFPSMISFGLVYCAMNLTNMIVHEKSTRLREFMKIMGLRDWVHWMAWFLRSFLLFAISTLINVILIKVKVNQDESIFTKSNPVIIFVLLMSTAVALIGFSFFCSALFDDEKIAACFAGFVYIIFQMASLGFYANYGRMSLVSKCAVSFLTIHLPMQAAFFIVGARELAGEGIQWENLWDGSELQDEFSVAAATGMLLLNGFIFSLAAFYTQLVFPGTFGVPLPWYFPLMKWYWTGSVRESSIISGIPASHNALGDVFEVDPVTAKAGIEIVGLSKAYGKKVVVKNVTLKMFENQVTSLLGHNGSGKTTAMSILAGLTSPSSGTALVNNFDIRKNMPAVQESLGFCPQYNILFDELTVEEHLKFYSKLKGYVKADTLEEIDHCLNVLGFQDKRHVLSKDLSGGMKRKLCVGLAFASKSKIVILDEPTAGMDPVARRSTWDLIQARKSGRTVLLSTHYMEEADVLGDRIAILADGQLQCCGSSLFLKSKYGSDYTLVVVKKTKCNVKGIMDIVTRMIRGAKIKSVVGLEITFILPGDQKEHFLELFETLDVSKHELDFEGYGLCSTSMEQVFFRVGVEAKGGSWRGSDLDPKHVSGSSSGISEQSLIITENEAECGSKSYPGRNTGFVLWAQQVKAMLVKKTTYAIRNKTLLLLQVGVPLGLLAYVLELCSCYPGYSPPQPLTLDLHKLEPKVKTLSLIHCPLNTTACQGYKAFLCGKYKYEDVRDEALSRVFLDLVKQSYTTAMGENILGVEEVAPSGASSRTTLIGFFNNQQLHTAPLALNFISNGLLRSFGLSNRIAVTNHPFDFEDAEDSVETLNAFGKPFAVASSLAFSLAFLTATFVLFPVTERRSRFKQLQVTAGLKLQIYWLVGFSLDFLVHVVSCVGAYSIILAFGVSQFVSWDAFGKYLILTGIFGWAMITQTMVASKLFTNASSAYSSLVYFNATIGFLGMTLSAILRTPEFGVPRLAETIHSVLLYHPVYAVSSAILCLGTQQDLLKYCPRESDLQSICLSQPQNPCCISDGMSWYAWGGLGVGRQIFHIGCVGLVSGALLVICESGIIQRWKTCWQKATRGALSTTPQNGNDMELLDVDAVKETRRINHSTLSTLFSTDSVVVRNVTVSYGRKYQAVKSLSFGVPKGEIFGLVGSNGAGKTTMLKMLTGELLMESGDAFINSFCVRRSLSEVHSNLGYCPQFDSCLDELTGRETLTLMARIRGIPESTIKDVVEKAAVDLLFAPLLDSPFGSYSGGNRRKLSVGLATLGGSSSVFLDEPTAGMDPTACRHIWDFIRGLGDAGTSVLLSSHNMEEVDALCSKLGIMVKGQFKCIGSTQHLKNKLCQGLSLMVQLAHAPHHPPTNQQLSSCSTSLTDTSVAVEDECSWEVRLDALSLFLDQVFPGCLLKNTHPGYAHFYIPQKDVPWSTVFRTLKEAKGKFHIDEYSVSQNNLEQVFVNIEQK